MNIREEIAKDTTSRIVLEDLTVYHTQAVAAEDEDMIFIGLNGGSGPLIGLNRDDAQKLSNTIQLLLSATYHG